MIAAALCALVLGHSSAAGTPFVSEKMMSPLLTIARVEVSNTLYVVDRATFGPEYHTRLAHFVSRMPVGGAGDDVDIVQVDFGNIHWVADGYEAVAAFLSGQDIDASVWASKAAQLLVVECIGQVAEVKNASAHVNQLAANVAGNGWRATNVLGDDLELANYAPSAYGQRTSDHLDVDPRSKVDNHCVGGSPSFSKRIMDKLDRDGANASGEHCEDHHQPLSPTVAEEVRVFVAANDWRVGLLLLTLYGLGAWGSYHLTKWVSERGDDNDQDNGRED